ncbi:hypothetical protein NG799_28965 [Laspinema sp. D1]|uniref:Uncharacterized protein n=1 Tax=Laspinema palackyanum D2a TaxID=2953684 RepID=A0ABT2N0R5_9CYAN|nr:hypothetical protein [Laspinema sp. D2a]
MGRWRWFKTPPVIASGPLPLARGGLGWGLREGRSPLTNGWVEEPCEGRSPLTKKEVGPSLYTGAVASFECVTWR